MIIAKQEDKLNLNNQSIDPIIIKVGVVSSSFLTMGTSVGRERFEAELDDYSWTVGDQEYIINLTQISRKEDKLLYFSELLNYNKLKSNYDVILISGIQDEQILGGLPFAKDNLRMNIIKRNLVKFVKEGGGFIGHCGGSTIPIRSAYNESRTLTEYILKHGYFPGTSVKVYCRNGMPILAEHLYLERLKNPSNWLKYTKHPEYVGYLGYLYYNSFDTPCGIPMNIDIRDKNHPIFRGYHEEKMLIRWGAGPAYVIPIGNLNITNLADYPYDEDPYINESTRINYWTFNETIPLFKGFLSTVIGFRLFPTLSKIFINKNEKWDSIWKITDWDPTDMPIITDYANKSSLVAFNYPEGNENAGRILLSGCHPELTIWERSGNYIKQVEDTDNNRLYDGLIRWMNDSGTPEDPSDDRPLNESDYIINPLKWFVRREVAWAYNKIPDDYYPPVYGRSEVVDISEQLIETDTFTIICSVGKEKNEIWDYSNLSLYYRYNGTNSGNAWTDWIYYDSTYIAPWTFLFNAADAYGNGKYEFYSILNTTHGSVYNCDNAPSQADTSCYVGVDIVADFSFKPGTAYPNYNVYFESKSETKSGNEIIEYLWAFGEGSTSNEKNPVHVYSSIGVYHISLTVKNDELNTHTITKSIKVIEIPSYAELE